jgi:holliday junction DNA helicase RuvA
MIGFLRGIIIEKRPPWLLLDVNGVGYEILLAVNTFYHLPDLHQNITLLTHLVVREDAHQLFGFIQRQERDLFRALIKVNGVGPKLALAILSGITAAEFVQCVQNNDISRLVHIPGIGKKTAERLIIETRDALGSSCFTETLPAIPESSDQHQIQDAVSALTALGYKPQEAQKAIQLVSKTGRSSEELIRLALQNRLVGNAA